MNSEKHFMDFKSIDHLVMSYLSWNVCSKEIEEYEQCKKTGTVFAKHPFACDKTKIPPVCLPILNDVKECLFQGDLQVMHCKEELAELNFCHLYPDTEYLEFLAVSSPAQKEPRKYDFHLHFPSFDFN